MIDPFSLLNIGSSVVGGLSGVLGGGTKNKRIEEEYNRKAYGTLQNAQEANRQKSPEAIRRAQLGQLEGTKNAAVDQALNAATAQTANTGGGVINGQAGLAGVSAATAAATPYAQQAAAIEGQKFANESQKVAQEESLGANIASLSNHVSYLQEQARNPLKAALEGTLAGATAGGAIGDILNNKDVEVMRDTPSSATGTETPATQTPATQTPAPVAQPQAVAGPPAPEIDPATGKPKARPNYQHPLQLLGLSIPGIEAMRTKLGGM